MGLTALQLVKAACYEANIPAPSALVGATDTGVLQLVNLFYSVGRDLRQSRYWPQLKKRHSIYLEAGRNQYPLPQDFHAALPDTTWDKSNSWQAFGPLGDAAWNLRIYGAVTTENRKAFRIFGPANPNDNQGQLVIDPLPGAGDQFTRVDFEYISKSWLTPPLWTASASIAQNAYRFSCGNIYKKQDSGTESGSTIPPNMAYGVGRDGSVFWKVISASVWQISTVYAPGDYRTNSGSLYVCTVGGTSAGSGGPTSTTEDADITDNTVTWRYLPVGSWTGSTAYEQGDVILISATYFLAVEGGITSKNQPNWTATTVADGSITWEPIYTPYEALVTDDDLCLFDDDVMIRGLIPFFMRAKGMNFASQMRDYEKLKDSGSARWVAGGVIDMSGPNYSRYPNIPEGSWE